MSRFQILSLAGGGIRGAFITAFVKELEDKLGRPLADSFDLIAGTSTGGIVAAGLAAGMSANDMHDFYVRYGAKIFTPREPYQPSGVSKVVYPVANKFLKEKLGSELSDFFRSRY